MKDLQEENENMKKTSSKHETHLANVEYETDKFEQFSPRNSLRISRIKEDKDENTDLKVIRISRQLGVEISLNDIDKLHRIGKLETNRAGQGRG